MAYYQLTFKHYKLAINGSLFTSNRRYILQFLGKVCFLCTVLYDDISVVDELFIHLFIRIHFHVCHVKWSL